jgi:hypothetical protein
LLASVRFLTLVGRYCSRHALRRRTVARWAQRTGCYADVACSSRVSAPAHKRGASVDQLANDLLRTHYFFGCGCDMARVIDLTRGTRARACMRRHVVGCAALDSAGCTVRPAQYSRQLSLLLDKPLCCTQEMMEQVRNLFYLMYPEVLFGNDGSRTAVPGCRVSTIEI